MTIGDVTVIFTLIPIWAGYKVLRAKVHFIKLREYLHVHGISVPEYPHEEESSPR